MEQGGCPGSGWNWQDCVETCPHGMVSSRASTSRPLVFLKLQVVNSTSSLCLYRTGTLGHSILSCRLICDPYYNLYFSYKKNYKNINIYNKTYVSVF